MKVLDVRAEANQLLINAAALGEQRGLLQQARLIHIAVEHFAHALLNTLKIGLLHALAHAGDLLDQFRQAIKATAKIGSQCIALALAHGVEGFNQRIDLRQHGGFESFDGILVGASILADDAGQAEDGVEVGLRG